MTEQAAQICEEMARELWNDEATPLVMRQHAAGVLKLAACIIRERVKPDEGDAALKE
jgi:hypothetical protein